MPQSSIIIYSKFLSLVIAKSVFQENFCVAHELRLFRRHGKIHTATYSDFVDDETGLIERRGKYMREYYELRDKSQAAANDLKIAADKLERDLNPDLAVIEEKVRGAGIVIAHPEFNYHVSHGSTVFFETFAINIAKLAMTTPARNAEHVIELLSLIQALEIERVSRITLPTDCDELKPFRKEIVDAGLVRIYPIVFNLLANGNEWKVVFNPNALFDPNEFGKWGLDFWRGMADRNPVQVPCPFNMINPKAYGLLMEEVPVNP